MEPDIGPGLHSDEETEPLDCHEKGKHSKESFQSFRVDWVQLGEEPVWSSLEDKELVNLVSNLWHDLDSGGCRANHADSLALDVSLVVPLGGVEAGSTECLQPRYLRQDRLVESSTGGYEEPGLENPPAGHNPPHGLLLPPAGRHHPRPQLDMGEQGELPGEGNQILFYFRGGGNKSEIGLSLRRLVECGVASLTWTSPGWGRKLSGRGRSRHHRHSQDMCCGARYRQPLGPPPIW